MIPLGSGVQIVADIPPKTGAVIDIGSRVQAEKPLEEAIEILTRRTEEILDIMNKMNDVKNDVKSRKLRPVSGVSRFNVSDLLDSQAEILARAQQIQSIVASEHIKRKQMQNASPDTELQLNSYVLRERPEGILNKDSRPDKLSSHYRAPYRVISYNGSRIDIQNVSTKQIKTVHISELVPFKYNPDLINPHTVALQADQEFDVEKILDIKGSRNTKTRRYNRKDLFVKVLWKGYPDDDASWEPYKELTGFIKFYDFCRANQYMYLINNRLFS